MKALIIGLLFGLIASSAWPQGFVIDRHVISSGGGHISSGENTIDATIGEPVIGQASSSRFFIDGGFSRDQPEVSGGCPYVPGDINGNGIPNGIDVVFGVNYFKGISTPPDRCDNCPESAPFYAAVDVNGNCAANGIDITFFVRYLKGQTPSLLFCADCPPAPAAAPAVMPIRTVKQYDGDKEK